jgi:hypothetical protein
MVDRERGEVLGVTDHVGQGQDPLVLLASSGTTHSVSSGVWRARPIRRATPSAMSSRRAVTPSAWPRWRC